MDHTHRWSRIAGLVGVVGVVALLAAGIPGGHAQSPAFCGYPHAVLAGNGATTLASGTAYQNLSVTNAAAASPTLPTFSKGGPLIGAVVLVEGASIRELHTTASPTTTNGAPYGPGTAGGTAFISCGSDLRALQVIGQTAATATVHFFYYAPGS